jgi:hypothetical protein
VIEPLRRRPPPQGVPIQALRAYRRVELAAEQRAHRGWRRPSPVRAARRCRRPGQSRVGLGAEARSPEAVVLQQALGAFMARGTG